MGPYRRGSREGANAGDTFQRRAGVPRVPRVHRGRPNQCRRAAGRVASGADLGYLADRGNRARAAAIDRGASAPCDRRRDRDRRLTQARPSPRRC